MRVFKSLSAHQVEVSKIVVLVKVIQHPPVAKAESESEAFTILLHYVVSRLRLPGY